MCDCYVFRASYECWAFKRQISIVCDEYENGSELQLYHCVCDLCEQTSFKEV